MKEKRILYALGNVRDQYIEEMIGTGGGASRRPAKRLWLVAAIIALMLLLVGCIAYVLSLNDLKLAESPVQEADIPEATEVRDIISLQGFVGSANYQAAKEWYEFQQVYDPDGKILQSLSNKETMMPEEYWSYSAYTPEMTAKVDEICEKYGLNKQGMAVLAVSEKNFYQTLKIDRIVRENAAAEVTISPEYFYKTGSFLLSCDTTLTGEDAPWIYPIEYQYNCVMKTDFDDVFLNVGDIESFDQWTYTTADGTEVLLALGADKALVIVDMENAFVTMNILNPRVGDVIYGEQMMTREALEAFADIFDFSFSPQPVSQEDWDAARQMEAAEAEDYLAWQESWAASDANPKNQKDIADYIRYLYENEPFPEKLNYALYDLNGDGSPELFIGGSETTIGQVVQFVDGSAQVNTLGFTEGMYLCAGDVIEKTEPLREKNGKYMAWFSQYTESGHVTLDCIAYDPELDQENPWFRSPDGDMNHRFWEPITEEEYQAVREKYARIEIKLSPLGQYPLE